MPGKKGNKSRSFKTFLSNTSGIFSHKSSSAVPVTSQATDHEDRLTSIDRQKELNTDPAQSTSSTRPSSPEPESQPSSGPSFSDKAKATLHGVHEVLKILERSTDLFLPLKTVVGAINASVRVYEMVSGNREEVEHLLEQLGEISILLKKRAMYEVWPDISDADKMAKVLDQATTKLEYIAGQGRITRYAKNAEFTDEIRKCCRNINAALRQFQLELGIQQERTTADILKETVLSQLKTSDDAPFTTASGEDIGRQGCTPGTRLHILEQILDWAKSPDPAPSLFWLYGLAGIGKTAIAMSLCKTLEEHGSLASSYFCSIQLDSKQSKYICPTVAWHLSSVSRAFANGLVSQLRVKRDLAYSTLKRQIDGLLCIPWKSVAAVRATLPPLVVVIDALDECDRGVEFLTHLLEAVDRGDLQGIRFFVTSRPVPKLLEKWRSKAAQGHQIALHNVERHLVDRDIHLYLQSKLDGLESSHVDIDALVSASGGLFIFAATVIKYIFPPYLELTPDQQVRRLQSIMSQIPGTIQGIDDLYARIVKTAFPQPKRPTKDELKEFKEGLTVLHAVISAMEPLTAKVIAGLTKTKVDIVRSTINALHSVLYTATDGRVHIFHASFHDFIIDKERSADHHCDLLCTHLSLSKICLQTLTNRLRFNICRLESSFTPDDELVPPLDLRVAHYIGPFLAYACQHWWDHWKKCDVDGHQQLSPLIRSVLRKQGIFWIEAMSLLGQLPACKSILQECVISAAVIRTMPDIPPLAKVAAEMVSMFTTIPPPRITSHLYLSILATWNEVPVLDEWRSQLSRLPRVIQRQMDGRQYCTMMLNARCPVRCVAFSPDGKKIVAGSDDKIIRIWNAEVGEETHRIEGLTVGIESVAFSPDGKRLLSSSGHGFIQIWDVESGEEINRFEGHSNTVCSVAFSPDGKQVLSGSHDRTIRIWDIEAGEEIHCFEGHTGWVESVAFSHDGKRAACGPTLRLWDVEGGKEIHCPISYRDDMSSAAFSSDDKRLLIGTRVGRIQILDFEAGKLAHHFEGHTDWVQTVTFSLDSKRVVSGSRDRTIRIWDVESNKEIYRLDAHAGSLSSVRLSPDGQRVLSGSKDGTIRIWDVKVGEQSRGLEGHTDLVSSVAYSSDGKRAVSGSFDKTIRIWDVEAGKEICRLKGHTGWVQSVTFSPDGKRVASGSNCTIRIWHFDTGQDIQDISHYKDEDTNHILYTDLVGHTDWVQSVAFSPDGKRVASGSYDRTIRIWDVEAGKEIQCFEDHIYGVQSVAFSFDGKLVTSGSRDKTIRLWDLAASKEIRRFDGHRDTVSSVAFSPDDKHILSGSRDGTIRLWNAESGEQISYFEGHTDWVETVSLSFDCKRVVSGSRDKTVRIWDVEIGKETHCLEGHTASLSSVMFSPDGKRVLSGSHDGTIQIWDVSVHQNHGLQGPTDWVRWAAYSCNDKGKPSTWGNRSVSIWDAEVDQLRHFPFSAVEFLRPGSKSVPSFNTLHLKATGISYHTREDGWIVTSKERTGKEEKLLWLLPSLRPFNPPVLQVFSRVGFNQIDLTDCVFGVGWNECFIGSDHDVRGMN